MACATTPYTETKILVFEHAKPVILCSREILPQIECTGRCSYQRHLSPIVCTNLNYHTEQKAVYECNSKYTLPEGYSLTKVHVLCQDAGPGIYYTGTCRLQYHIRYYSDDDTWTYTILWWMGAVIAFLLVIIFCPNVGIIVAASGSGKGGTSVFAT